MTILCHSVRFWRSPLLSLNVSSVASQKVHATWPPLVYRVSGSLPSRPTKSTLLTDISCCLHLSQEHNTPTSSAQIATGKFLKRKGFCCCCVAPLAFSVVSILKDIESFSGKK